MTEVVGYASLQVIPVLQGLQGNLQQMMRPLLNQSQQLGVQVGNNIASGVQGAEGKVRQASQRMKQAREDEADAAGRARVAEAELNETRARGDATASQLIRAEENLRQAQRDAEQATRRREQSVDDLSRAQSDLANSTDDVDESTDQAAGGFGRFGEAASGAAGKVAGLATAVVGIGSAIELGMQGIENQQITNKLAAQMGATGDLAAEYGVKAGTLYRAGFGESMEEAADTIGMVASAFTTAGFEGEKSMEEISQSALNFSTIFDQDVGTSIQTASLLVTNGLAKDSTEAFDLMTASFQRVPAAMREELPEILQEYGTNFRALGLNGEESFSLLVSAAEQGKFALDKTGDALKEFTIRGSDMSTASTDAFKALGLDATQMATQIAAGGEGAKDALQSTAQALLGMEDPAERANTAIALFGTPLEDLSVDQIPAFLEGLTGAGENMAGFAGSAEEAGNTLNSGVGVAFETFKRQITGELLDGLNTMASFLMRNADTLKTVGLVLAPVVAGIATYAAVTKTITIAQAAWTAVTQAGTAAQWAMNIAMKANPVGLIIAGVVALGAALVLAYQKSETFRNIVQGAWEGIKNAASAAWDNVLKPTIDWIVGAFQWVGDKAVWLWNSALVPAFNGITTAVGWLGDKANWLWTSVISPVFNFISTAARVLMAVISTALVVPFMLAWDAISAAVTWAWDSVISPYWEMMKAGLGLLGDAFRWAYESVIKPVWDALGAAISWVWNSVISPTWDALKAGLVLVQDAFSWAWNNVIKPTWDALGAGISWVWNSVVSPVWESLKAGLVLVQDAFSWAWNNVIKPVWDALGAGIKWVWDNVVSPVWESFKSGLSTLQSSFETAVGFIGQVWDRIKSIVAAPVRFVVETVYNNGIREAWNKVAGFLNLEELAPVDLGLLGAYASGGVIPGYTPGRDTGLIAVGGGEAVMRPEWTKAMGSDYVDGANAAARMGGVQGVKKFMGAFANGGIVESIVGLVNQHFPGMTITSTYRNSNDHHGAGKAVDFSDGTDSTPGMQAAAQWFYENYGGSLLELIHSPFGNNVKDGSNVGDGFGFYGADTMAAHRNHVHVAAPFALDPSIAGQMDPSIWDRIKGAASSAMQSLRSVVARLFDGVMDPIGNAIPSFGDSQIGQLPKLAFDKFRTSVRDWILGQADQKGGVSGGSFDVAPGSGPIVDQVREAFTAYGWGEGAQWDAANWIIGKESSWNPTARNPDSGAFGLFQFLGGTKDQYLPDENPNPKIQGDAGARYIRDRYGDPLSAKAFWEQNGWYDQGGLASGVGLMLKNVVQPERVLSPEMTKHFERLVDVLEKPEFVDALKTVAPAQSDPTAASAGEAFPGAGNTTPTIGGTGVEDTYTSDDDKWAEWQKNANERFTNAGQAFVEGQLEGMPFGNHLRAMRDRGSQINVIVQDMYEAIEKIRQEERRKTVASGSRF
ncbi:aggregation-promoting factor C-terminal-like domain-containing protein [Rhodococcus artemisiae]|uniref:Transglycosylase SLT domain-containing protein n=1 Tax=Rhodococcus artemisiae TaxID=714159 RepID=A0ABU7LDJ6_9NOCA|nr:phage tail tape measure protein [Rhodococcus artemisiae]MEE2058977.1 transglycosylase SLT domain-containing protein [Rhodococcus artemisiae]